MQIRYFCYCLHLFPWKKNSHRKGKQPIFLDAEKHLTKGREIPLTCTFIHSLTHSGNIIKHLASVRLVTRTVDMVVNKKSGV